MLWLLLFFPLVYLLLMLYYRQAWLQFPVGQLKNESPKTKISVIVPARNEGKQIAACLRSIHEQNYPQALFEIILVDDHSEDDTVSQALALNIPNLKLIHLSEHIQNTEKIHSYKKKAIETAIGQADGLLIVCTDADCIVPKNWLLNLALCHEQQGVEFIAGPVAFFEGNSLLERFQALDFLGMMLITGAGISGRFLYMCNGANLAYTKSLFYELNGFEGINKQASGDDMLLLQKAVAKYPTKITFLKTKAALVMTAAQSDLKSFLNQRIRWASKSGTYTQWGTQAQLALVWLSMLSILVTFFLIPFYGWSAVFLFLLQWLLKALADYLLLSEACRFFQQPQLLKVFFPSLFLHWAYILWVGLMGNVRKSYQWKGRKVK